MQNNKVKISVIVPTHNRADALQKTLNNLLFQDFEGRWEVVVVNNNSTDDTNEVVRSVQAEFPVPLHLFHEKIPGPAAARNCGVKKSAGEFIVFIDNDILVEPDFVRQRVKIIEENPGCWFVGKVVNPKELRETPFGRYRDDLHQNSFRNFPSDCFTETSAATGQDWAMRKKEFIKIGGFDEDFSIASCEDAELALRARQNGIRNLFNPKNVVVHNDWAVDLDSFCKRQYLYSISSVLLWQKYGAESGIQIQLFKENSPIDRNNDSATLIGKKIIKRILANSFGKSVLRAGCNVLERIVPDSKSSYKAYTITVSLFIFSGVREGFRRYTTDNQ
ncbi:MAG TPA: glycosyltransferase family 2 protein [Pyrinomonadaceae bacterium]|nr:glycosyltransferase family 2 protein [Pyrinomonadaceae bacterium]